VSRVEEGLSIANYLLTHAHVAFAEMGADPAAAAAQTIRDWLERVKLEQFSKRDAWRALRGRFGRASDLDAPLEMLVEHGYLREQEPATRPRRGRRPSTVYLVNPLGHNGHNGPNAAGPEQSGDPDTRPEISTNEAINGQNR
jgi:hypothetical protein